MFLNVLEIRQDPGNRNNKYIFYQNKPALGLHHIIIMTISAFNLAASAVCALWSTPVCGGVHKAWTGKPRSVSCKSFFFCADAHLKGVPFPRFARTTLCCAFCLYTVEWKITQTSPTDVITAMLSKNKGIPLSFWSHWAIVSLRDGMFSGLKLSRKMWVSKLAWRR